MFLEYLKENPILTAVLGRFSRGYFYRYRRNGRQKRESKEKERLRRGFRGRDE